MGSGMSIDLSDTSWESSVRGARHMDVEHALHISHVSLSRRDEEADVAADQQQRDTAESDPGAEFSISKHRYSSIAYPKRRAPRLQ